MSSSIIGSFACIQSRCAFIDGHWVTPLSGEYFDTIDPATEEVITQVANCGPEDVDRAVAAAYAALNGPHWGYASSAHQRASFLRRLAVLISENRVKLSWIDSLDEGKPRVIIDNHRHRHLHD
jgi:acyl-CoA reductase-like NAD-dependent aldehyde dehydrogenase